MTARPHEPRASVQSPRLLDVALGFYEEWQNKLYNSALYVTIGGGEPIVRHVHRKMFLPTYGLFDEERFVERGREVRVRRRYGWRRSR